MSNRAFGVEIECYSPKGTDESWTTNGVNYTRNLLQRNGFGNWSRLVSEDSSLYGEHGGYGVEVKSPILQGREGFSELKRVMEFLRSKDFWVEDDCGLHVHLNAPEYQDNNRLILKVVKAWMRNQDLINNMVADHRLDNSHCEPWNKTDLHNLMEYMSEYGPDDSHRGAINVGALCIHGTIEIRQHEGTLNPEEAIAWIKFCQGFVDTVTGTTVQKIGKEELLLKRLKVERNASRFLTTKARIAKQRRGAI